MENSKILIKYNGVELCVGRPMLMELSPLGTTTEFVFPELDSMINVFICFIGQHRISGCDTMTSQICDMVTKNHSLDMIAAFYVRCLSYKFHPNTIVSLLFVIRKRLKAINNTLLRAELEGFIVTKIHKLPYIFNWKENYIQLFADLNVIGHNFWAEKRLISYLCD